MTKFKDQLVTLVLNFLSDKAFQIRKEATDTLAKMGDIIGSPWFEEQFFNKFKEFKTSPDYLLRVNSLLMTTRLKSSLKPDFINTKLLPEILSMKDDPIPNIKINISKCIESLAQQLTDANVRKEAIPVLKKLAGDTDFDVKYYAEKAMQQSRIHGFCF